MSTWHGDRIESAIQTLANRDPIKVWSWLTTIFGDLARAEGDALSGAVLTALSARIDIKPQAMRVALHRLRKDGWILAHRSGRTSRYDLSEGARAETVAASRRIYAPRLESPPHWRIVIPEPGAEQPDWLHQEIRRGALLALTNGAYIGATARPRKAKAVLTLEAPTAALPLWIRRHAATPETDAAYRDLNDHLEIAERALEGPAPTLMQSVTLRLLIVHHWRRVLLRRSPLVEMLNDENWVGAEARRRSIGLLADLPRPAPDALADAVARGDPPHAKH